MTAARVSADELRGMLAAPAPGLVVLDVSIVRTAGRGYARGQEAFQAEGHVPGALFADVFDELSDGTSGLPFTLPSDELLSATLDRLGITAESHVVVYDRLTGAWAARVWYLLRAAGHGSVSVLDGGYAAWLASGGAVEHGPAREPEPSGYRVALDPRWFAGTDEVAALSAARTGTLVCALRAPEFTGERSTAERRGHIPGSINVPYLTLLTEDGTLDADAAGQAAERMLAATTAADADDVVLYCGGGINASGVALALHEVGFDAVRVYDGSMSEWFADPSLPLETGA